MDSGIAVVLQIPCRISSTILVHSVTPVYLNNTAMLVLRLTSLERYVSVPMWYICCTKLAAFELQRYSLICSFNWRGVVWSRRKNSKHYSWWGSCICLLFSLCASYGLGSSTAWAWQKDAGACSWAVTGKVSSWTPPAQQSTSCVTTLVTVGSSWSNSSCLGVHGPLLFIFPALNYWYL